MAEIEILVAPNGVGVPEELQHTAPNLPMLMSLAGVVGALVRQTSTVSSSSADFSRPEHELW